MKYFQSAELVQKIDVNETFIENDYLFQLEICKSDTIPQYIIDECTKEVLVD